MAFLVLLDPVGQKEIRMIPNFPCSRSHPPLHVVFTCYQQRGEPPDVRVARRVGSGQIAFVDGDEVTVDFTGTDPQIRGFKNSGWVNTWSAVSMALASYFEPDLPRNEAGKLTRRLLIE